MPSESLQFVDCHTHVSAKDAASGEFARMLDRCDAMGIAAIVVSLVWEGDELELEPAAVLSAGQALRVAVRAAMGFEPPSRWAHVTGLDSNLPRALDAARAAARAGELCAIGEVGLDYYWPLVGFLSDQGVAPRERIDALIETRREELLAEPNVRERLAAQRRAFEAWIALAEELDLPLVVHERDAWADAAAVLAESRLPADRVMIHCFSAGVDALRDAQVRGYWVSLPASMTYRQPYADEAREIDLEQALIETDAPYQTPIKGLWKRALAEAQRRAAEQPLTRRKRESWTRAEKERLFRELLDEYLPGLEFEDDAGRRAPAAEYFQSSRRRNVNETAFVRCAAVELARAQGAPLARVAETTTRNAARLFGLDFDDGVDSIET